MRIDCHMHTTRYSSCSVLEPDEMCHLASQRGLDAVVLTEHFRQWGPRELSDLRGRHPGLRIFSGVEVSLLEGYDVVCVGECPSVFVNGAPDLESLLEAVELVRDQVFLFVAHPFRYVNEVDRNLRRILGVVDGVEMNSINLLRRSSRREAGRYLPWNWELYEKIQREYGLVPLYNTDCHAPQAVGTLATELETPVLPEDEAELAALLKSAATSQHQRPDLLRVALGNSRLL